ncbi:unnamed protein product [Urochloa decumbens]|uniref:Myb-like domain-containing protein n=1 Tax=Urochloa decumbens TaxID=240449 RepID=A0ABC9F9F5_9POAL
MEDYVNALSAMSVSISEEGLLDAADGVGRADSSMSAPPPVPRKAARNKQANFSAYEDNILCKAWLEISCDAAINTGQRRESFWLRVVNRYKSCCSARKYPERSQKSIMSRWDFIKTEVSKFSGYMADVMRSNRSGMSDADKSVTAAANFAGGGRTQFHPCALLADLEG